MYTIVDLYSVFFFFFLAYFISLYSSLHCYSYAEVRKNYNKMVSLMDDPSMRLDLSKGYSSNDSMSEMSFSLKDTSSEGSYKPISVQQAIVSEKVYEPSRDNSKTGSGKKLANISLGSSIFSSFALKHKM